MAHVVSRDSTDRQLGIVRINPPCPTSHHPLHHTHPNHVSPHRNIPRRPRSRSRDTTMSSYMLQLSQTLQGQILQPQRVLQWLVAPGGVVGVVSNVHSIPGSVLAKISKLIQGFLLRFSPFQCPRISSLRLVIQQLQDPVVNHFNPCIPNPPPPPRPHPTQPHVTSHPRSTNV